VCPCLVPSLPQVMGKQTNTLLGYAEEWLPVVG
jgi:hypothetical protein